MADSKERTVRRHRREKAAIDQAAKGVSREVPAEGEPALQPSTTETGLPVEGQIRKKWNSRKGGLPTFYRG